MKVLKWDLLVNDKVQAIGNGQVVLVACQHGPDTVQVWTEEIGTESHPVKPRDAVIVGTGHRVPEGMEHIGSTLAPMGLVWHVYAQEQR